ncbi:high frequency lysogenization protein HflD [Testudinibacter sp. TR-2022]|uniref:high frequency lysogenization protein HflD n=1 Tax=Testudinibacter sp. TR-2022 TaxID=2585029 RepID=UPI001118014A|nr:high frequency lysogenization protein HflD [Testudinibacter sp. TR-2022]TNH07109.1 high frequency lysogenization protein HflD [Pasteurellaceae bacterium Phil11]TNH20530.1 high frequency lysogenization protein HflD [Testudinibacter sp. TR-2022]TNH29419.1 high frequency lysogenization protein HflD [Testudinibacter sp. TR-2022]
MADYHDLTLALAGVCQAAKLVRQFSEQGSADQAAFAVSLKSLINTSPKSTLDVYGDDPHNLKLGLSTLLEQVSGAKGEMDINVGRYWMSLIALEAKLEKNPQSKQLLGSRIQGLDRQLQHFELLDDQMIASIAAIYVDVISPLGAKIQVKGSPVYLQQTAIQNRVRATLLCGIRSAVLWRQLGGSRLKLLFSRNKYYQHAQQIYSSL